MGRVISVGLALLLFFGAFSAGMKGPKWDGSPNSIGYYTGIALFAGLGVLCLFLPAIFSFLFTRRAAPSFSDATYSGNDRWQRQEPTGVPSWTPSRVGSAAADPFAAPSRGQPRPAPARSSASLGSEVSVHPPSGLRFWPIGFGLAAVVLLGVAAGLGYVVNTGITRSLAANKPVPDWVYAVPAVPAFLGLCCVLGCLASSGPRPTVRLFTGGIGLEHNGEAVTFRWDEIAEYRKPYSTFTGTWVFELTDGRVFKAYAGVRNVLHFGEGFLREYGGPALVEQRLQRIRAGEVVRIGDFQVSRDAIYLSGQAVPWQNLTKGVIQIFPRSGQKFLRLDVAGRVFTWKSNNLFTMKSEAVFLDVLERLAPPHIWRA